MSLNKIAIIFMQSFDINTPKCCWNTENWSRQKRALPCRDQAEHWTMFVQNQMILIRENFVVCKPKEEEKEYMLLLEFHCGQWTWNHQRRGNLVWQDLLNVATLVWTCKMQTSFFLLYNKYSNKPMYFMRKFTNDVVLFGFTACCKKAAEVEAH